MKRRVVVTGLGAVTPVGNTVEEFWSSVREGKVGIGPITKFDTSEYKVNWRRGEGFSAKSGWISKQRSEWSRSLSMQ